MKGNSEEGIDLQKDPSDTRGYRLISTRALEALQAENKTLRALVEALADDLTIEVEARFEAVKRHPAMRSRYERDMANVYEARRILGDK